jgi:hypothetical protein
MRYSQYRFSHLFVGLTIVLSSVLYAQEPKAMILERDEVVQREFFTKFLSQYSAEALAKHDARVRSGRFEVPDRGVDFGDLEATAGLNVSALLQTRGWALDMLFDRIKAIRSESGDGGRAVVGLLMALDQARRPEALGIVSERLKGDPEYEYFVKRLVNVTVSDGGPSDAQLWRQALESNDKVVREVMRRSVMDLYRNPGTRHWKVIVSSIVDRYGHSPTAVEMATDPFFTILTDRTIKDAQEIRSQLLSGTEKEHLRRQLVPSVVRR